ncbi:MAG: phosphatidate cytidylyltransferase [Bryobacteraceae bacterium]
MSAIFADAGLVWLLALTLALLVAASVIGLVLSQRVRTERGRATVSNMNARIVSWWVLCSLMALALAFGDIAVIALFAIFSLLALREFTTLTPTHRGDHRTLFWSFFAFTPLQYLLVWSRWYGMFSILIPVYAFLYIPTRTAVAGDSEHFLERTAKIHWGLMVCTYCFSHAPALLVLTIPGYAGQNAKLLFYFLLVVELSDVMQYVWGKLLGKRPIVPRISPGKTWEGFIGGILSATAIGTALWWATPFQPWQAAAMSLVTTLMGFAGGLTMSAIKRERGVKDYGTIIVGHGGVLDRIDALCFSAPVFFHLTRYFFSV